MGKPTAILTSGQREYLRGEREPAQERTMRTRIRSRLRQSLYDLELILDSIEADRFSSDEFELIVENTNHEKSVPIWTLPAVLFLFTKSTDISVAETGAITGDGTASTMDRRCAFFDRGVETGVQEAIQRDTSGRVIRTVESSLTVELGPNMSDLQDMDLATLPRAWLDQLLKDGVIDDDTFVEAVKDRFERVEERDTEDLQFRP